MFLDMVTLKSFLSAVTLTRPHSNCTLGYLPDRKTYVHTKTCKMYVHNKFTCNSQNTGTNSLNEPMGLMN